MLLAPVVVDLVEEAGEGEAAAGRRAGVHARHVKEVVVLAEGAVVGEDGLAGAALQPPVLFGRVQEELEAKKEREKREENLEIKVEQ